MNTEETFLEKTIELENELTGKIDRIKMNLLYLPAVRYVDLGRAINEIHLSGTSFSSIGFRIQNSHIFYLDSAKKMYVSVGVYPFSGNVHLNY